MVKIKKVRGATLLETLVATVLIVVVFLVASMVLNGLTKSYFNGVAEDSLYKRFNTLEYEINQRQNLKSVDERLGPWSIVSACEGLQNCERILLTAEHSQTGEIIRYEIRRINY